MTLKTLASVSVLAGAAVLAGCNQSSYAEPGQQTTTAGLTIEPSSREIVVGETVTLVARTRDTYGRDAKLKWSTTAGSLSEEQDGRVARVKFNEVGTYTVKATLNVDGNPVQTDMVEIRVKAIR